MQEIRRLIHVDFVGKHHNNAEMPPECARRRAALSREELDDCFVTLGRTYMFYLALENSDCDDYITEKLYRNSFIGGMVPVVRCFSVR